mgnify:CR=1 FL=1
MQENIKLLEDKQAENENLKKQISNSIIEKDQMKVEIENQEKQIGDEKEKETFRFVINEVYKLMALSKKEEPGKVVIVCFPALIKSAS